MFYSREEKVPLFFFSFFQNCFYKQLSKKFLKTFLEETNLTGIPETFCFVLCFSFPVFSFDPQRHHSDLCPCLCFIMVLLLVFLSPPLYFSKCSKMHGRLKPGRKEKKNKQKKPRQAYLSNCMRQCFLNSEHLVACVQQDMGVTPSLNKHWK